PDPGGVAGDPLHRAAAQVDVVGTVGGAPPGVARVVVRAGVDHLDDDGLIGVAVHGAHARVTVAVHAGSVRVALDFEAAAAVHLHGTGWWRGAGACAAVRAHAGRPHPDAAEIAGRAVIAGVVRNPGAVRGQRDALVSAGRSGDVGHVREVCNA